jgi:hypothetical protein
MCLDKLYKKIDQTVNTGYKVFISCDKNKIRFLFNTGFAFQNRAFLSDYPPINQWIYAYQTNIITEWNHRDGIKEYTAGFHFFKTEKQAQRYKSKLNWNDVNLIIKQIKVKNITAYGVQNGIRCFVASQMLILEDSNVP